MNEQQTHTPIRGITCSSIIMATKHHHQQHHHPHHDVLQIWKVARTTQPTQLFLYAQRKISLNFLKIGKRGCYKQFSKKEKKILLIFSHFTSINKLPTNFHINPKCLLYTWAKRRKNGTTLVSMCMWTETKAITYAFTFKLAI